MYDHIYTKNLQAFSLLFFESINWMKQTDDIEKPKKLGTNSFLELIYWVLGASAILFATISLIAYFSSEQVDITTLGIILGMFSAGTVLLPPVKNKVLWLNGYFKSLLYAIVFFFGSSFGFIFVQLLLQNQNTKGEVSDTAFKSSPWDYSENKDPITDVELTSASTIVKDDTNKVKVDFNCAIDKSNKQRFYINFGFFDDDNNGKKLRIVPNYIFPEGMIHVDMRFGDRRAVTYMKRLMEVTYLNELKVCFYRDLDDRGFGVFCSRPQLLTDMLAENTMIIRPKLSDGEPTFTLNYSYPEVQRVFSNCSGYFDNAKKQIMERSLK